MTSAQDNRTPVDGRRRVVVERVTPTVDGGRFPIKRVRGERVVVEADVFTDGHDLLSGVVQYRPEETQEWREERLQPVGNDRWRAVFPVESLGRYCYRICAWVDHFKSWQHELAHRAGAEDIALALQSGGALVAAAAQRAPAGDAQRLAAWTDVLTCETPLSERRDAAASEDLMLLMTRYTDRSFATYSQPMLWVIVDPELARFSAWYEFFPRSCASAPGKHGTFRDCEAMLHYVADMGFDIVYLPPIHPIGRTKRKGSNNTLTPQPTDPGSPWAIGAAEGGHKSIHPELGDLEDFRAFVAKARALDLQVALDIAFQCAPDHPYVKAHPEWFRWRPDGTVQYAENPPKKYQDIYPFHFEGDAWQSLWDELLSVFLFWIEQGVTVFRVDNPHTKPFPFWEWVLTEIKRRHPEAIFLSEAFARPRVLHRLAKLGFTQSYNYFPWRNTKWEITEYLTELTRSDCREYLRPNLWPNTPDILTEYLQIGGRPAFMTRLVLAATLGASYGIYGPAFECLENTPREPGSEEYHDSEKYQTRQWDLTRRDSLRDYIARVNAIRRESPALHQAWNLHFYPVDNEQLLCYAKYSEDMTDVILVVVNLDPFHTQSGWVELPLAELQLDAHHPYQMHDLLGGARFLWNGSRNYIELNPHASPAHIFRLRRKVRGERDFEYFF